MAEEYTSPDYICNKTYDGDILRMDINGVVTIEINLNHNKEAVFRCTYCCGEMVDEKSVSVDKYDFGFIIKKMQELHEMME